MQTNLEVSVGEQVVSGTLWMGSWRWSARLIGFVTTIILARLLVPEDFGIVATGAIIVGFFTLLIDLGTDSYLIRLVDPDRNDYDTAWTLRLIVISAACCAIFLAAQPGADYFDDQRLVNVIRFFSIAGWLNGFTNIGLTMYRRELQFRKIAFIGLTQRIIASITSVTLAFLLHNYWAMIIGESVFMIVGVLLSYIYHDYRPRFSLVNFRKQWEFCKWIVSRNLATIMQTQGDSFVVARFFGIELMGFYSMGMRFAALPTRQLLAPVLPPVYSGLAKKQGVREEFVTGVLNIIGITFFLMLPAAALFATLGESLITAMLGEQWISVIPLVAPLTISVLLVVLTNPSATALTIEGRVKLLAGLNWFSAISVVAVLLFAAQWQTIELLAWARVAITFIIMLLYYKYLLDAIKLSLSAFIGGIYRPILATLVMIAIVYYLTLMVSSAWLVIVAGVLIGSAVYLCVSLLLWRAAGAPNTGEALLVRKFLLVIFRAVKKLR